MALVRFLVRLLARLGLRWLIVSGISRYVVRRFGRASVERATEELETRAETLPAPVARMVRALPVEARQVGGSAVVAGRATRSAVDTTRRVGRLARTSSRQAASGVGAARAAVDTVRTETENSRRRFRARYLAATMGPAAATDSLLDVRTSPPMVEPIEPEELDDPHDRVPEPVSRRRFRSRRRASSPVGRVRRSYRPDPKPWE
jgi:hypothetical protein